MSDTAGRAAELLRALIANACVNDGTPESGQEIRSAETLAQFFAGTGVEVEVFEPLPGRASLVARLRGDDPDVGTLCFLAHTDVVPAVASRWSVDPFAGEVHDGCVWGRGGVDMLNQTAAHAVAVAGLAERARSGDRLGGDVVFVAAADEEAGGAHGTGWLASNAPGAIACDWAVGEGGGFRLALDAGADDAAVAVMVGEKGPMWQHLTFEGVPGHGSMPYATDNALVKAAAVAQRLAEFAAPAALHDVWHEMLEATALPDAVRMALSDAAHVDAAIADMATSHPAAARPPRLQPHDLLPQRRERRHQGQRRGAERRARRRRSCHARGERGGRPPRDGGGARRPVRHRCRRDRARVRGDHQPPAR